MRNYDTPVREIRHQVYTEVAKAGFESSDESLIHDIESIPYNIVSETAQYRESIYRNGPLQAKESVSPWVFLFARKARRSI